MGLCLSDISSQGERWWLKADDPWQCLATCFELHDALESGDPYGYMSYLPVHQDGTCNGLQHYAALGGDDRGARQVNLSVTDRPSDVYTYVAEMVEQRLQSDVRKGDKWAEMLAGKVSRKVVKQTVSTSKQVQGPRTELTSIPGDDDRLRCDLHRGSFPD
jgi:DNA-directed RNA polymerase